MRTFISLSFATGQTQACLAGLEKSNELSMVLTFGSYSNAVDSGYNEPRYNEFRIIRTIFDYVTNFCSKAHKLYE